jgi:hypothetical protein
MPTAHGLKHRRMTKQPMKIAVQVQEMLQKEGNVRSLEEKLLKLQVVK